MLIPAARANKLFGKEGGLMLTLYPAFPDDFAPSTPLFVRIDDLDVPLWCEQFERRGKTGALVRFADIDTERRATELLSKELFIEDEEAEEDDTFYMEDLIGFRAAGSEAGQRFAGEVTDYLDSDTNPLLEVTTDAGHTVLIPAAEEFIARIGFDDRTIEFILPEGLTELNAKP